MIANPLLSVYLDSIAWWTIHWYFFPYAMLGNNEVEKFAQTVSLNGIKSSSICR